MGTINIESDIVIVGSGAAGSTLAKELSKSSLKTIVLERGNKPEPLGKSSTAMRVFDGNALEFKNRSVEGNIYYRAICSGGTSVVNLGNALRGFERELKKFNIDLSQEFEEAEKEMNVSPAGNKIIGSASQKIAEAGSRLGYRMLPMPKCVDQKKCISCGMCVLGCAQGAKWSGLDFLYAAQKNGIDLYTKTKALKVIVKGDRALGIEAKATFGKKINFYAKKVILSAGALATPIILMNSGLKEDVGYGLFQDSFTVVYGIHKSLGMAKETPMTLVNNQFHESDGYIFSPYIDIPPIITLIYPNRLDVFKRHRMMGLIIKIKDEAIGRVFQNGKISKAVTDKDKKIFNKAIKITKEILLKAGVNQSSISVTPIRGAHPGGTAPLGRTVNSDFETKIKNLFVCDASVLPEAIGAPPMLPIVALAKKLSKKILKG